MYNEDCKKFGKICISIFLGGITGKKNFGKNMYKYILRRYYSIKKLSIEKYFRTAFNIKIENVHIKIHHAKRCLLFFKTAFMHFLVMLLFFSRNVFIFSQQTFIYLVLYFFKFVDLGF